MEYKRGTEATFVAKTEWKSKDRVSLELRLHVSAAGNKYLEQPSFVLHRNLTEWRSCGLSFRTIEGIEDCSFPKVGLLQRSRILYVVSMEFVSPSRRSCSLYGIYYALPSFMTLYVGYRNCKLSR